MKEITEIAELHQIELGIMRMIRDFCDTHGIRYFLCGGTLLGAIRHKGFIPWDDDADIGMLRPDLERFCKEFNSERYAIISAETDNKYVNPFPKVIDKRTRMVEHSNPSNRMGVFIDLCPFDGAPGPAFYPRTNSLTWKFITHLLNQRCRPVFSHCHPFKTTIVLGAPFRLIPNRFLARILDKIASRHHTDTAPFVGGIVMGYGPREILPRSVFEGSVEVEFEGERFLAMSGWQRYLSALYGDYMTLPPPEARIPKHHFKAWWTEGIPPND